MLKLTIHISLTDIFFVSVNLSDFKRKIKRQKSINTVRSLKVD